MGAVMLAVVFVCSTACQRQPPLNVVIVTFDTTRADAIGCYGNERVKTPAIDGLAEEGTRFEHAYSAVPITLPSHTTILTGRYPTSHGVRDNGLFVVDQEQVTLAEILSEKGYRTAAAVASFPLDSQFQLDQGFEFYDDHFTAAFEDFRGRRTVTKKQLYFDERNASMVNEAILPWLETHASEAFFMWVHYFDPHHPLDPPAPYNQLYASDPYLGEIAFADESLGRLVARLEGLELLERTLIVVTADHGEGRGDHNELTHSTLNYDSTLHVPLVFRMPGGQPGGVVSTRVGLVDIVPTILELAGIDIPSTVQGRSLADQVVNGGEPVPEDLYAETLSSRLVHGFGELRTIISGRLKYIHGPRPELFDLDDDPDERHDLVAEWPDEAARLRSRLEELLRSISVQGASSAVTMDQKTRQRLIALGYLHGSGAVEDDTIEEVLRDDGTPPQDRVGDINDVTAAKNLLVNSEPLQARDVIRGLVERAPTNIFYLQLLATAEIRLGRLPAAMETLDRIRALDPRGLPADQALLEVVGALVPEGRAGEAISLLQDQQGVSPSATGQWVLASLYALERQPDKERQALETSIELDSAFGPARVDLAAYLDRNGRPDEAEVMFREALDRHPYYVKAHYNFGIFLFNKERAEEAVRFFERAVVLEPDYLQARYALVLTLVAVDRADEAREQARHLMNAAPNSQEGRAAQQFLEETQ